MPDRTRQHAGKLRHRISILTATDTRDNEGGVVQAWATSTHVWASVQPIRSGERFNAQAMEADITHRVTIRARLDATTAQRRAFLFGSRVLNIHSIRDIDERGIKQECLCTEQTNP